MNLRNTLEKNDNACQGNALGEYNKLKRWIKQLWQRQVAADRKARPSP